ncbi:MAG: DUF5010 domain-containing protein [Planctomycetota bacterium]|jgi:hypothetical protein
MISRRRYWFVLSVVLCSIVLGADEELPQTPPGKYFPLPAQTHKDADTFKAGEPIVGTSYFYWYDIESKSHIIDGDGTDALTTHPADMKDISYKRPSWHKQQLKDMVHAGVDFLMPVFWGVPARYDGWSFTGLPPLVQAHSELLAEGAEPPMIGLFYDTSILQWNDFRHGGKGRYHVDLSTQFGKDWFCTAMRDFFSLIPPGKWARIDGKPIVFLYSAHFAKSQDEKQFEYVKKRFAKDFGIEPFIVKASDWKGNADATYAWGGAVNGPLIYRKTIALGPGYDHSAVPNRSPLIVERNDGKTYIDRWRKMLQLNPEHRPSIVHVETWNEWHEGTDIAHSREYGRLYIELTRLFSDLWHQKAHLQAPSPFLGKDAVRWQPSKALGLDVRPSSGDGIWKPVKIGRVDAIVSAPNPQLQRAGRYLYFNIDDAFAFDLYENDVTLFLTYLDRGCSSFRVEYDSSNSNEGRFEGAFRPGRSVEVGKSGEWKTAEVLLKECRFMNRCNGVDLRLAILGGELTVGKVRVERMTK